MRNKLLMEYIKNTNFLLKGASNIGDYTGYRVGSNFKESKQNDFSKFFLDLKEVGKDIFKSIMKYGRKKRK